MVQRIFWRALICAIIVGPAQAAVGAESDPGATPIARNSTVTITRNEFQGEILRIPAEMRGEFVASPKRVGDLLLQMLLRKTLASQARTKSSISLRLTQRGLRTRSIAFWRKSALPPSKMRRAMPSRPSERATSRGRARFTRPTKIDTARRKRSAHRTFCSTSRSTPPTTPSGWRRRRAPRSRPAPTSARWPSRFRKILRPSRTQAGSAGLRASGWIPPFRRRRLR